MTARSIASLSGAESITTASVRNALYTKGKEAVSSLNPARPLLRSSARFIAKQKQIDIEAWSVIQPDGLFKTPGGQADGRFLKPARLVHVQTTPRIS